MTRRNVARCRTSCAGRVLFAAGLTYEKLSMLLSRSTIKSTRLTETFGINQFLNLYGSTAIPLFLADDAGNCVVIPADNPPTPQPGQTVIALIDAAAGASVLLDRLERQSEAKSPAAKASV